MAKLAIFCTSSLYSQYVGGHETLRYMDDLRADEYLIYRLIFMLTSFPLPEFFLTRDIRVSENRNLGLDRLKKIKSKKGKTGQAWPFA